MSGQDATRVGRDARHYREHQSRKQAQQKEQRAPPSESFHGREGYRDMKGGTMRNGRRSFHAKSRQDALSLHLCLWTILSVWNSWTWDFVLVVRRPLETTPFLRTESITRSKIYYCRKLS